MIKRLLLFLTRLESLLWIGLFALSSIVVGGISTLVRGLDQDLLTMVTLGGLFIGWLMTRIRAPWWLAVLIIMATGFQMTIILVGHLLPLIFTLVTVIAIYLVILLGWGADVLSNLTPFWTALQELGQGSSVVFIRLWTWLISLGTVGTYDPLPVQLIWGWALWFATAWAAYIIWQNRQALLAVIPLGVLLTVTLFFSSINNGMLSAFIFLALALQTANSWKRKRHRWETNKIDWATDLAQDIGFAAATLIFLIVTVSTLIPQISLAELINKLQIQRQLAASGQRIDNMAASLGMERKVYPTPANIPAIPYGMPRRHLLGSGPELSEQLAMLIKTNDPKPFSPYERLYGDFPPPPAYYWLAVTFDTYRTYGWVNSPTINVDLEANKLQLPSIGPSRIITQTVRLIETPGNLLFTAGYPLRVDQASRFNIRTNQDWVGTTLETGESYIAQSWLSQATPDELRNAGTDYPEWMVQRYLALPDSLPSRVRSLALELTATAPTPYDRAIALEEYLRTIPYSLDVTPRPVDQDVVDYFLFDLKQGYCDYYATSMVVMARAAGLPARLAIGYAPSPYDYATFQYVVRESEAHSWTQIYFPGYGWIDFEPTGGRAPIDRSTGEEEEELATLPELPNNFDLDKALAANQTWWDTMPLWQFLLIGLSGVASIAMSGALIVWGRDQRLARLPVHQLVPLLESRLETGARQLGTPVTIGATPLEFQTAFLHHLEYLAKKRASLQKIVPSAADIAGLVNAFVYLRYGPQPTKLEGNTYLNIWRRLRWRLWGTIIVKKVRRIR